MWDRSIYSKVEYFFSSYALQVNELSFSAFISLHLNHFYLHLLHGKSLHWRCQKMEGKRENEAKKENEPKKRELHDLFVHRNGKSRLKTRWCFLKQPNNEKIIENKYRSVELNIYYIIVHRLHGFKILKFGFYLPPACLAASSSVLTFISRSLCLKIKTLFT